MIDDFTIFDESKHMLSFIGYDTYDSFKSDINDVLLEQLPEFKFENIICMEGPEYMTTAIKGEDDSHIVSKMSVVFKAKIVGMLGQEEIHSEGIWNFVGVKLNDPENMECAIHYDVDSTIEEIADQANITVRLYNVESNDQTN